MTVPFYAQLDRLFNRLTEGIEFQFGRFVYRVETITTPEGIVSRWSRMVDCVKLSGREGKVRTHGGITLVLKTNDTMTVCRGVSSERRHRPNEFTIFDREYELEQIGSGVLFDALDQADEHYDGDVDRAIESYFDNALDTYGLDDFGAIRGALVRAILDSDDERLEDLRRENGEPSDWRKKALRAEESEG